MDYSQELASPEWKQKRQDIILRDRGRCRKCKTRNDLQVHHLAYIAGVRPWQVPDEFLKTLCEDCHKSEEKYKKEIVSLVRQLSIAGNTFEDIFNHLNHLTSAK